MTFLKKTIARLLKDEKGVTLVEYAIALTLAVGVGTAALSSLSGATSAKMDSATDCLEGVGGACTVTP